MRPNDEYGPDYVSDSARVAMRKLDNRSTKAGRCYCDACGVISDLYWIAENDGYGYYVPDCCGQRDAEYYELNDAYYAEQAVALLLKKLEGKS